MKRVQWSYHSSSTIGATVVLLTGEEVQGHSEYSTDFGWVWTGTKGLFYEADHRGHQQTTLLEEIVV